MTLKSYRKMDADSAKTYRAAQERRCEKVLTVGGTGSCCRLGSRREAPSTYLQHETTPQVTEKCKTLQHDLKSLSNKTKRYSEDDYIQIITNIKNCPWRRHAEEYENFRAKLASCCDAVQTFVVSQNNTPMGTNMSYEVESKGQIPIRENIFQMFPVSQPFVNYPYNQCAVVGNGGILNKSLCGAEINKADFVFRCNLPPVTGNASKDVGNKTNLVTVNPSIITLRFNTGISFKVYQTLHDSKVKQKVLFFHPSYLRRLALFWRTRGVTAYRLSTGLMIASVAVELCKNVTLYGFWPFSKNIEKAPISHHYYDNKLPKRGFHQMPKEFNQMLQLHMRGILKLQLGKCDVA
ncbi:hypothetical protein ACRRTK_017987 [Alexandromys fortis]